MWSIPIIFYDILVSFSMIQNFFLFFFGVQWFKISTVCLKLIVLAYIIDNKK
jgi:hypothetical protein